MPLDFLTRAILGGIGLALIAGPLGSIIVWRRMANFGDALGHSTLLGVCMATLFHIHPYIGITLVCLLIAFFMVLISRLRHLANDTILSILAYATLAIGLVFATTFSKVRMDLLGYLYGDILAINTQDLIGIGCVDLIVIVVLVKIWRQILSITIHEELAKVEGAAVAKIQWILILLMAIVFAVAMKLIGILLITALLIIPASSARQISKTPEQMALFSSVLGCIAVYLGISASSIWDWPAGPAIVVMATIIFILSIAYSKIRNKMVKIYSNNII